MEYSFKIINQTFYQEVAYVFNKTRAKKMSPIFFKKKYTSVNNNYKYYGCIAYTAENEPVAHMGLITVKVKYNNQIILVAYTTDNVTVKDHQRKGLFKKTTQILIDYVKSNTLIEFVFCVPNTNNYQGFIKHLDFQHIKDYNYFSLKCKTIFPFVKLLNKMKLNNLLNPFMNVYLFILRNKYNGVLQSSILQQGKNGVIHDEEFYIYKSSYNKHHIVKLGKNILWFKFGDGIIVGDVEINDISSLKNQLQRFCYYFGIHKVEFFVNSGTNEFILYETYLEKSNFQKPICIKKMVNNNKSINNIFFTFSDFNYF